MSNYEVFYKSPHNYDLRAESDRCAEVNDLPSTTVQSMSDDADINVIMKRYGLLGAMPDNPRVPTYDDFSGVGDFRTALHAVRNAQEAFGEYPAELRARFGNDPQLFMDFVHDPKNLDEMRRLGLAKAVEVVVPSKPLEVVVVSPQSASNTPPASSPPVPPK